MTSGLASAEAKRQIKEEDVLLGFGGVSIVAVFSVSLWDVGEDGRGCDGEEKQCGAGECN